MLLMLGALVLTWVLVSGVSTVASTTVSTTGSTSVSTTVSTQKADDSTTVSTEKGDDDSTTVSTQKADDSTTVSTERGDDDSTGVVPHLTAKMEALVNKTPAMEFVELWRMAQDYQEKQGTNKHVGSSPHTVVAPHYDVIINFVPQDTPSPLYSQTPEAVALRTRILRDYFLQETIRSDDPRMSRPGGYLTKNMNNKPMNFTRNSQDELLINGFPTMKVKISEDELEVYVLNAFLFDHYNAVSEARVNLSHKNRLHLNIPFN